MSDNEAMSDGSAGMGAAGGRADAVQAGKPSELPFTFLPIAGFWRRIAAFAIDGLLLGAVGQALAWPLSSVWFQIGPYGRFVGQLIALMYFSLMDSRFGNGQSVGKRLLRLAVRGGGNQPIGIGRSMLRTLIWLVPLTLNGWALPLLRTPILAWFTGVILFGVGGAVLFTMVFNRRTRQGLHDMCAGTYVVRVDGEPIEALPIVARLQWIVAGVIVAVAAVLVTGGVFLGSVSGTPPQQVITLQGALERDHRFFSASVFDRTTYEIGGNTSRALRIEAWYKGVPSEDERKRAMSDVAKAALDQVDGVGQYDLMQISVTSAYDLGIATGRVTYNDTQPIDTWRERVGEPSAPHSGFPLPN